MRLVAREIDDVRGAADPESDGEGNESTSTSSPMVQRRMRIASTSTATLQQGAATLLAMHTSSSLPNLAEASVVHDAFVPSADGRSGWCVASGGACLSNLLIYTNLFVL